MDTRTELCVAEVPFNLTTLNRNPLL